MKKKKKQKWCHLRHRIVQALLRPPLRVFCRVRYGLRLPRLTDHRQMLVLSNHQTAFDQFFLALLLRRPLYFLASEDLFAMGWLSRFISYLVAPIPIRKSTTDARAVMTAMRVAREGGSVALFPEGNRTYSGRTCEIKPSVVGLVRALRLPLVLVRIEGGFGTHPRWSDVVRRGRTAVYPKRTLEPEEIAAMSDEALYRTICDTLATDESLPTGLFRHRRRAEYLERAFFFCPFCGIRRHKSHLSRIRCLSCGREVEYGEDKQLTGVGFSFPFRTLSEWYGAQESAVRALPLARYRDEPLFTDTVDVYFGEAYKKKPLLSRGARLSLYADRVRLAWQGGGITLHFDSFFAATVLGKNKLNLYCGTEIYQIKGDARFSALLYLNVFYRHREESEEHHHAGFLGI